MTFSKMVVKFMEQVLLLMWLLCSVYILLLVFCLFACLWSNWFKRKPKSILIGYSFFYIFSHFQSRFESRNYILETFWRYISVCIHKTNGFRHGILYRLFIIRVHWGTIIIAVITILPIVRTIQREDILAIFEKWLGSLLLTLCIRVFQNR